MVKYLKVPEGLLKKANEKGVLDYLRNWYFLKSIKIDGDFHKNEILDKFGYSSTAYKLLAFLRKEGWIKVNKDRVRLISYDELFAYFNYDMSIKVSDKGIRRGKFKVFKIKTGNFQNWFESVVIEELRLKFSRQAYRAKEALKQKRKALEINFNVLLSVRSVSELLGYSSSSTGFKILEKLEELKLIQIHRSTNSNTGLPNCNFILIIS